MKILSIDSRNSNPDEHKDNIVKFKNGTFGSVFDKKLNRFVWKKYNEDKYANAVNAYIYWNDLKYNSEFIGDKFKVKLSVVEKVIKSLAKEFKKESIDVHYIKNQGKWFDGVNHFVDYLWTDVCAIVEKKHKKKWTEVSFIFTDDIYVLRAMLNKKLIFQHNIAKNYTKIDEMMKLFKNNNKHIIQDIKPHKINMNKSIEIIFK